ncbi:MAG TPA: helix-turn-helix domain-containing protein [Candidatus Saccharimonadales bacterium]|nr:helix-turn-helix domain-containing protein [Candidatus Saccharimonadales bacterium]
MQAKVLKADDIESRPGCVEAALCILGNKWTALILKELHEGPRRFSSIESALPGISPRTLSQRLDELESAAVITKKSYAEVPPRVEYSLTKKGEDLMPILRSMAAWGDRYQK